MELARFRGRNSGKWDLGKWGLTRGKGNRVRPEFLRISRGSDPNFSVESEGSLSPSNLAQSCRTFGLVLMKTKCVTHFATPIGWVLIVVRSRTQSGLILLDRDRFRLEQTLPEVSVSEESRSNTEHLLLPIGRIHGSLI